MVIYKPKQIIAVFKSSVIFIYQICLFQIFFANHHTYKYDYKIGIKKSWVPAKEYNTNSRQSSDRQLSQYY